MMVRVSLFLEEESFNTFKIFKMDVQKQKKNL